MYVRLIKYDEGERKDEDGDVAINQEFFTWKAVDEVKDNRKYKDFWEVEDDSVEVEVEAELTDQIQGKKCDKTAEAKKQSGTNSCWSHGRITEKIQIGQSIALNL